MADDITSTEEGGGIDTGEIHRAPLLAQIETLRASLAAVKAVFDDEQRAHREHLVELQAAESALSSSREEVARVTKERDMARGAMSINYRAAERFERECERMRAALARLVREMEVTPGVISRLGPSNGPLEAVRSLLSPAPETAPALDVEAAKGIAERQIAQANRLLGALGERTGVTLIRDTAPAPETAAPPPSAEEPTPYLTHDWDPASPGLNLVCRRCGLDLVRLASKRCPSQCDGAPSAEERPETPNPQHGEET